MNEHILNLKKYISEDPFYNGTQKIESDFDSFCYNHCQDIAFVLARVKEIEEKLGL